MRHRSHHPMSRAARQLRIRIQSDDVTYPRKYRDIAGLHREAVVHTPDQAIKIEQLAPLALPSHPHAFTRVVNTMPMQQRETAAILATILSIERFNQTGG